MTQFDRRVELKRLASCTLGKMVQSVPNEGDIEAPYLRAAHVQPHGRLIDLPRQTMWFSSSELRALTLRRGDVVVVEGGAGYGRSSVLRQDLSLWGFQNSIIRIRPNASRADGAFLDYSIQAALASGEIESRVSTATIPHFTAEKVARLPIFDIPVAQQRAIARYLDRETAQIGAFIARSDEVVALLTERRATVVARGVTKGASSGVELRASGVEWMGDVPAHWAIQRLASTVARARNGVWGDEPDGGTDDIRCVRVADFDRTKQRIHEESYTKRKVSRPERAGRLLQAGDLLLEKSGGGEKSPVGFVVLYDKSEPAVCSNFVARVQLRPGMEPRFWTFVHGAMYRLRITERSLKQSTGIQNLDQSAYFNEYVGVPPFEEQRMIAEDLEQQTAKIDRALSIAMRGIELARERRAALISAAVTGKIDVGAMA